MTPAQYHTLEIEALRHYDRLRFVCPHNIEIIYVVSNDVMRYMRDMEASVGIEVKNGNDMCATFRGVRLFVEEDRLAQNILSPAVCGRHYFDGMEVGDLIIADDLHIYLLERIKREACQEPTAHFVDINRFVREAAGIWSVQWLGRPCRNGRVYTPGMFDNQPMFAQYACNDVDEPFNKEIQHLIEESVMYNITAQPMRKHKEEEFSAGDTKLLDEYIHSFIQTGA